MYRSYSVNDMPEPVRYYGNPPRSGAETDGAPQRGNPPENRAQSNVHNNGGDAAVAECPPERPPECPHECPTEYPPECPEQPANSAQCASRRNMQHAHHSSPAQYSPYAQCAPQPEKKGGLLSALKNDDLILLAVVFILLMDGCDDKLLLAALGLVFFSDYFGF